MFLMIWVNDFWTLDNIPKWLKHAKAGEDYLGFSDLIFPWFLFIVGLSIPFAIENRKRKGESDSSIVLHLFFRSLALLVMGFFHVNFDTINAEATGISRSLFVILSTAAFFLVWNSYAGNVIKKKYIITILQISGIILLFALALIYKGNGPPPVWMQPQWWGILGLIGWAYVVAAPAYLIFRNKKTVIWFITIGFIALNVMADLGVDYNIFSWQSEQWFVGNGSLHALTFGGIITSLLLMKFKEKTEFHRLYSILLLLSIVILTAGFILHKYIIISKISSTSTWVMFSLASSFFLFAFLHWIVDYLGKSNWFAIIRTAGTATLTCYLVPYFYYSIRTILEIELPDFLTSGIIGLFKSMAYAFIIIGITWLIGKVGIRLKI